MSTIIAEIQLSVADILAPPLRLEQGFRSALQDTVLPESPPPAVLSLSCLLHTYEGSLPLSSKTLDHNPAHHDCGEWEYLDCLTAKGHYPSLQLAVHQESQHIIVICDANTFPSRQTDKISSFCSSLGVVCNSKCMDGVEKCCIELWHSPITTSCNE